MNSSSFSSAEIAQFQSEGYVIARGMTPLSICEKLEKIALRDLAAGTGPVELETDTQYPGAPPTRDAPGGSTVRRLLQAYSRDAAFAEWATGAPLAERLKQLLGPRVELSQAHHNCIMTKAPAFSSETHWHRDIRYWSFEKPELVSVWLALGEERVDNGCLLLLPGSHRMEFSADRLDDAKFLRADVPQNRDLLRQKITAELRPGDVLFFHCRLFHAAGNNRTAQTKFSAVFTYHAADNQPLPGSRSSALPDIPM